MVAKSNKTLYRAYLLKEHLRLIMHMDDEILARDELNAWLKWAARCRIKSFVELGRKIHRRSEEILSTIKYQISSALSEATNNKIKLTIRIAYGFRNLDNMIDMVMLRCGSVKIPLPFEADLLPDFTHKYW